MLACQGRKCSVLSSYSCVVGPIEVPLSVRSTSRMLRGAQAPVVRLRAVAILLCPPQFAPKCCWHSTNTHSKRQGTPPPRFACVGPDQPDEAQRDETGALLLVRLRLFSGPTPTGSGFSFLVMFKELPLTGAATNAFESFYPRWVSIFQCLGLAHLLSRRLRIIGFPALGSLSTFTLAHKTSKKEEWPSKSHAYRLK